MVDWKICVKIRDVTPVLFQRFPGLTKSEMLHNQPCNGVWTSYKQMYFFSSKMYRISHTTLSKTEMIQEKKDAWRNVLDPCTKKKLLDCFPYMKLTVTKTRTGSVRAHTSNGQSTCIDFANKFDKSGNLHTTNLYTKNLGLALSLSLLIQQVQTVQNSHLAV
jgi:hypothetical protein